MRELEGKKIQFLIILISILMIFFGIVTKYFGEANYNRKFYTDTPLNLYVVNFFGLEIPYVFFTLFFVVTLGIGIYLFAFKIKKK
jgi:uncharacterized membrane protein YidH (DUF202 family)